LRDAVTLLCTFVSSVVLSHLLAAGVHGIRLKFFRRAIVAKSG